MWSSLSASWKASSRFSRWLLAWTWDRSTSCGLREHKIARNASPLLQLDLKSSTLTGQPTLGRKGYVGYRLIDIWFLKLIGTYFVFIKPTFGTGPRPIWAGPFSQTLQRSCEGTADLVGLDRLKLDCLIGIQYCPGNPKRNDESWRDCWSCPQSKMPPQKIIMHILNEISNTLKCKIVT